MTKEKAPWPRKSSAASSCKSRRAKPTRRDKSFSFDTKTAPASFLLKKAAGLKPVGKRNRAKGSDKPGRTVAGSITVKQVREIAEAKMKDLSANDVEQAMKIILGSARSIGIEVKG